ncbi:MAG: hypothetical protein QXJ75_04215 [Candidatus Bathyarchaeia archaeon]
MYAALYESWLRESSEKELQPLPKDFYVNVGVYRKRLREKISPDDESLEASLLRLEDERSAHLLRELIELRLRKMNISLESKNIDEAALTMEEERLYQHVKNATNMARAMLEATLHGVVTEKPSVDLERRWVLRFLKEVPALVGGDMKVYGPFDAEDVASLPSSNAEGLIKHGVCRRIDVR